MCKIKSVKDDIIFIGSGKISTKKTKPKEGKEEMWAKEK